MNNKPTVSIAIGTTMFARYADLPNTVSHAIAEFIDNALQSYRNNKADLSDKVGRPSSP